MYNIILDSDRCNKEGEKTNRRYLKVTSIRNAFLDRAIMDEPSEKVIFDQRPNGAK